MDIADISVTFLGKIRNLIFQNSFWNFSIVNTIKCIFAMILMLILMMMMMLMTICPASTVKLFMVPAILGPPVHLFPKSDCNWRNTFSNFDKYSWQSAVPQWPVMCFLKIYSTSRISKVYICFLKVHNP